MLPADPSMVDRNQNALPGTIVDTDITTPEPGVFDFYMQSRKHFDDGHRSTHNSCIDGSILYAVHHSLSLLYAD